MCNRSCLSGGTARRHAIALGIIVCFNPVPALAYLDPGTGSIILQALLAAFAIVAGMVSVFWQRLKNACSSLFPRKRSSPTDPGDESEE